MAERRRGRANRSAAMSGLTRSASWLAGRHPLNTSRSPRRRTRTCGVGTLCCSSTPSCGTTRRLGRCASETGGSARAPRCRRIADGRTAEGDGTATGIRAGSTRRLLIEVEVDDGGEQVDSGAALSRSPGQVAGRAEPLPGQEEAGVGADRSDWPHTSGATRGRRRRRMRWGRARGPRRSTGSRRSGPRLRRFGRGAVRAAPGPELPERASGRGSAPVPRAGGRARWWSWPGDRGSAVRERL